MNISGLTWVGEILEKEKPKHPLESYQHYHNYKAIDAFSPDGSW